MSPPMTQEALELSRKLALELGQGIKREGRVFIVPSRTRGGLTHQVAWALDGELLCDCEAATLGKRECWAVKAVREELEMTEQSTAIVPIQLKPTALLPSERDLALIDKAAVMAFNGSVTLPKELNTPQKVAAVMLYGLELGLAPMTALRHLYIVNGRVAPSAEVMAGLLKKNHPDARLLKEELTDVRCTMRLIWPSRGVNDTYTVTWEDIKRAKLDRDNNLLYPQDRLLKHCTKRLLRIYAPDVINGMDQGAPIIDAEARELDDDDEAALYNEGDEHAYIDGQVVNRETGEVVSPPTAITDEQKRALTKALQDAASTWDKPSVNRLYAETLRVRWPHAFKSNMNLLSALNTVEADEVLALLRGTPADDQPPPHEHELSMDEANKPVCRLCGVEMELPAEDAAQASLIT